mmetsp:Transcript_30673/g.93749  ORF Transcript_30673/g.93749 Transcript_30673/m.93749 type:complete len:360 (+) Transcript_30673:258-1337(+)
MPVGRTKPRVVEVALESDQRLRDEFTCPILHTLMRDPVIAADGHSYDRSAIDRWLLTNDSSPLTAEKLEHKLLIPNRNLKLLIESFFDEGGSALYTSAQCVTTTPRTTARVSHSRPRDDDRPLTRRKKLATEPVLVLKCLGPGDSEWNGRRFEVTTRGVVGGRQKPDSSFENDVMSFSESTVSRRHFSITYERGTFRLEDLGSASGTFHRLRPGAAAPLRSGTRLMLGRHQFHVSHDAGTLVLACFAPEGSPLVGTDFFVDPKKGATLGRRATNDVAFTRDVDGQAFAVDSSVSAEHARILRSDCGRYELRDGSTDSKPSTNGTWLRLDNRRTPLASGDELLIGTIRFHVSITETFVEV